MILKSIYIRTIFGFDDLAFAALGSAIVGGITSMMSSSSSSRAAVAATNDTNQTNLAIAQGNNETAINLMRENNQFNHDEAALQWQRQMDYNDPSAVRSRYEAAGLNPLMGLNTSSMSMSPADSSSVPSLTTPTMQSPAESIMQGATLKADAISKMTDAAKSAAEIQKIASENKKLDAETDVLKDNHTFLEATLSDRVETEHLKVLVSQQQIKESEASVDEIRARIRQLDQQTENLKSELSLNDQRLKNMQEEFKLTAEQAKAQALENIYNQETFWTRVAQAQAELGLTRSQSKYFVAQSMLCTTEREAVELANWVSNKTKWYRVFSERNNFKISQKNLSLFGISEESAQISLDLLKKYGDADHYIGYGVDILKGITTGVVAGATIWYGSKAAKGLKGSSFSGTSSSTSGETIMW